MILSPTLFTPCVQCRHPDWTLQGCGDRGMGRFRIYHFIPKLSHIIFHPAISAVSAKPKLNKKIPPTADSLSPELLTI